MTVDQTCIDNYVKYFYCKLGELSQQAVDAIRTNDGCYDDYLATLRRFWLLLQVLCGIQLDSECVSGDEAWTIIKKMNQLITVLISC